VEGKKDPRLTQQGNQSVNENKGKEDDSDKRFVCLFHSWIDFFIWEWILNNDKIKKIFSKCKGNGQNCLQFSRKS